MATFMQASSRSCESKGGMQMGSRRKGERPIPKIERAYTADHPVARRIAEGDPWLAAWVGQMVTPWARLTKKTRISSERLFQLDRGADPTDAEIDALAAVWLVPAEGLRTSIGESRAVTRRVHARPGADDRSTS